MNPESNFLRPAEVYWNNAAETYERKFTGTVIGRARRRAVWHDLERAFNPGDRILELNCGPGIDAVHLSSRGVHVLACDISPRMIELAHDLAARSNLENPPDFRVLPNENLAELSHEKPFDGAFSNFSGLNCVHDLSQVARDVGALLKPRARLVVCMMGRFVPWEIVWFLAQGKMRKAFHRLREDRTNYSSAPWLTVQRPTVAQITSQMKPSFRLARWKGIGITVPPSYSEHIARHVPRLIDTLASVDQHIGSLPLFRNMADCVLLEFERTPVSKDNAPNK